MSLTGEGLFITFEGIDGSGKTVQCDNLYNRLRKERYQTICFREPGGTLISEKIRQILLNQNHQSMNPVTELLLYEAARSQLVAEKIGPALREKKIVLCDRFIDSTVAYQGYGRELSLEEIHEIHDWICQQTKPDLTIILHISWEESCRRRSLIEDESDRMENEEAKFFQRIITGYRKIAEAEPKRVILLDGMKPIEEIGNEIYHRVMNRIDTGTIYEER